MKVRIRRSGGYAGVGQDLGAIDTVELDASRADVVVRKVAELEQAAGDEPAAVGADMLQFEVAIEDQGKTRIIRVVDEGDPEDPAYRAVSELAGLFHNSQDAIP